VIEKENGKTVIQPNQWLKNKRLLLKINKPSKAKAHTSKLKCMVGLEYYCILCLFCLLISNSVTPCVFQGPLAKIQIQLKIKNKLKS